MMTFLEQSCNLTSLRLKLGNSPTVTLLKYTAVFVVSVVYGIIEWAATRPGSL